MPSTEVEALQVPGDILVVVFVLFFSVDHHGPRQFNFSLEDQSKSRRGGTSNANTVNNGGGETSQVFTWHWQVTIINTRNSEWISCHHFKLTFQRQIKSSCSQWRDVEVDLFCNLATISVRENPLKVLWKWGHGQIQCKKNCSWWTRTPEKLPY